MPQKAKPFLIQAYAGNELWNDVDLADGVAVNGTVEAERWIRDFGEPGTLHRVLQVCSDDLIPVEVATPVRSLTRGGDDE